MTAMPGKSDVCHVCKGWGVTKGTAPELAKDENGYLFTVKLGSGCPECLGTCKRIIRGHVQPSAHNLPRTNRLVSVTAVLAVAGYDPLRYRK